MKKIDFIICLFLCVFSLFTLRDLYKPYFYTSHDGPNQVVRLYYFDQDIREGQIPPRIAGGLLNGYSYPLFVFSYHMPWIIAEPYYLLSRDLFASIKFSFIVGYFLSGITMYWYLKRVFGRFPAVVGAFLYLYAPYRFVNIFVRAAIGDATAFIFPPLFFLALYELSKIKKMSQLKSDGLKWVVLGGIGIAGLILSHAMIFALFGLALFFCFFWNLIFSKNKKILLMGFISFLVLGVALSSYYFVPSFIERNYTQFASVMGSTFTGNTFLSFKDLLYSPWGYGLMNAREGGMSFQVGIAQWMAIAITFFLLIKWVISKKNKKDFQIYKFGFCFVAVFILTILAMLPVSKEVWKLLNNIVVIDFTWRILSVSVFSSAVLAAFTVSRVKFSYLLGMAFILVALYANRNHLRINQVLDWDVPFYLKLEKTTNMYDEYTPKWVQQEIEEKPIVEKVLFSPSDVHYQIIKNISNHLAFNVETPHVTEVTVNTFYYPGWELKVNGIVTPIRYKDTGGLMNFSISPGNSKVTLDFRETPLKKIANSITVITAMISSWVIIRGIVKKRNEKYERKNS